MKGKIMDSPKSVNDLKRLAEDSFLSSSPREKMDVCDAIEIIPYEILAEIDLLDFLRRNPDLFTRNFYSRNCIDEYGNLSIQALLLEMLASEMKEHLRSVSSSFHQKEGAISTAPPHFHDRIFAIFQPEAWSQLPRA
ncbi:hypothetical protein [Leptospirillum ferriphilum]|nr:hypothetical protein [Leptospirillum ferriphilum]